MAVANRLKKQGESAEVVAAGFLHDVLEDSDLTPQSLLQAGMTPAIVDAIQILTKRKNEPTSNNAYIRAIKANSIARAVKIADMQHNIGDNPTPKQIMRYARGLLHLVDYRKPASP